LNTATPCSRPLQVDLVGADAEAPGRHQLVRGGKHLGRQLRARADAQEVHVGDLGLEFGVGQAPGSDSMLV
jgi:DNA polymerase/3'-5' exonuclease PolX